MLTPGEIPVWLARLDRVHGAQLPPPLPEVAERAARLRSGDEARRYLACHGVLRAILASLDLPTGWARDKRGKPRLPERPDVSFSLSRSCEIAVFAVARGVDVGVDVERIRPLPDCDEIAVRFLAPSQANALLDVPAETREREFFRLWTRTEAALKALGVGLYGAGQELVGDWTIREVEAGEGYAAAVAVRAAGCSVAVREFEW